MENNSYNLITTNGEQEAKSILQQQKNVLKIYRQSLYGWDKWKLM